MQCRKCGKEIDELEAYCSECQELNRLIRDSIELNQLEITKEIENLNNFKNGNNEDVDTLKEELKDIVKIDEEEIEPKKEKRNTTLVIIITSIIVVLIVALVVTLTLLLRKEKLEPIEEPKLNYKSIIEEYGDSVNLVVAEYLKENEEIPSWSIVSELITYDEYEISCGVHSIYKDGNIYLKDCKVDGIDIKYTYGKEQEEKESKKIEIYKVDYDNYSTYNNKKEGNLVGSITCKTENCEYVEAYQKYVLIKEDKYYIYDYENNSMEFGPFDIKDNSYENSILCYGTTLYGVLYEKDNKINIYNLSIEKNLKDIQGNLFLPDINIDPTIMYKYGYAIFIHNDKNTFVNLNTGNVSYTITGNLNFFIEDTTKNLVYITTYNSTNKKITIYNSNGKKLFDGKEFNDIRVVNGNIILTDDSKYYIYDSNLKLKLTSNEYNNILGLFDDFIVVVDKNYLEIVDLDDNILATYDLKWDSSMYKFDYMLSGKVTENNEEIIYLIIERSNSSLKYYYNINTKEFGLK